MRPLVLSTCEKEFILRSFLENNRLDGRSCTDYRDVTVTLGEDYGSCLVVQGNTKIFAQASCTIVSPKPGRPAEGSLHVNLELSPMAAAHFESGRLGDLGVEVCRLLERSLKQSRCLDLESLCIVSGEKVWEIRLDVHVLDYDGTIVDAASVAAVSALRHFRIPQVTVRGDRVQVHTLEEKEPISLYLMHHPLCITFGICDPGSSVVVDLTEKEEQVIDGKIVIAMNSHRELCAVHCSGKTLFKKEQVLRCSSKAILRAKELTEIINDVFETKAKAKSTNKSSGFSKLIGIRLVTGAAQDERVRQPLVADSAKREFSKPDPVPTQSPKIVRKGKVARVQGTTALLPTEKDDSDTDTIDYSSSSIKLETIERTDVKEPVKADGKKKRRGKTKPDKDVQSLLNEIEDDVQILLPTDSGYKTAQMPDSHDEPMEIIDLTGALQTTKRGKGKQKKNK